MRTLNSRLEEKVPWLTTALLLALATGLGFFLRWQFFSKSDFVMNDGGLFYRMAQDLIANGFRLPATTTYNNSQIPFAYPFLSMYAAAFSAQYLHIDLVQFFRFYPLIFNLASIPAYYFLAKELTQDRPIAYLATTIYAISLPAYEWLIVGGGLTRSPAHTYFVVSLTLFLVYIRTNRRLLLGLAVLFAGLMVMHHIEYGWLYALSVVLFSLFMLPARKVVFVLAVYLVGGLLVTAPYWASILSLHGLAPFRAAFGAGEFDYLDSLAAIFLMIFTTENISMLINSLAILGLIYALYSKKQVLIIWLILIFIADSRSAYRPLTWVVSIFAAYGIKNVVMAALARIHPHQENSTPIKQFQILPEYLFLLLSILNPFFIAYLQSLPDHIVLSAVSNSELAAIDWVKEHTATDSRFLIMDTALLWEIDKLGEWFPALTQRTSLTTVQGSEWLPDDAFEMNMERYKEFKACATADIDCVEEWGDTYAYSYEYILVSERPCKVGGMVCLTMFEKSVEEDAAFRKVYANQTVSIYQHLPAGE